MIKEPQGFLRYLAASRNIKHTKVVKCRWKSNCFLSSYVRISTSANCIQLYV